MEEIQITPEMLKKNNIMSILPTGNINEVQGNDNITTNAIEVQYYDGNSTIITGETKIKEFLQSIYNNR